MCFTLAGRLQTRLAALGAALWVAWLFALLYNTPAYLVLFVVMAAFTLLLDLAVYSWLIGFQPRWLTLLLALGEFLAIKWVLEWPYPLEIRLRTRQALAFYLVAWVAGWLVMHVLLPLLAPRWQERGGVLLVWRWGPRTVPERIETRRGSYLRAVILTLIIAMPWLIGGALAGEERLFSGILIFSGWHLREYGALFAGEHGPLTSFAGVLGRVAATGWWSPFTVYKVAHLLGLALALLGLERLRWNSAPGYLPLAALVLVGLPPSASRSVAAAVWIAGMLRIRVPSVGRRRHGLALSVALCAWLFLWAQLFWFAPYAFLSQGEAQLSFWLAQQQTQPTIWSAEIRLQQIAASFGDARPSDTVKGASLVLTRGEDCVAAADAAVVFRHGRLCAVSEGLR